MSEREREREKRVSDWVSTIVRKRKRLSVHRANVCVCQLDTYLRTVFRHGN